MGVGTLRRYHQPVKAAKPAEVEAGTLARTDVTAEDVTEVNSAKVGNEQKVQRARAKADKADSVHPTILGESQLSPAAQADPNVGEGVAETPEPAKGESK